MSTWRGTASAGGRLDVVVVAGCPELSRARVGRLIREGHVAVDGEVITRPSRKVPAGSEILVEVPAPLPDRAQPQDLPLDIVYQDADIVVVNKAAGMVVHPAAGHADGTLVNGLLHHIDDLSGIGGVQRPGIVHRLDRDTSGLLVVAKHDRAHQHLAAQFADHSARRRYLAVCLGTPRSLRGTVRSHLARHPKDRVRFATTELPGKGKHAITHWAVRGKGRGLALLEFELETGRTHQIRVHATESGWPLCGDPMYKRRGVRAPAWVRSEGLDARTMLHAWRLRLVHPSNDTLVTFRAKPPTDFEALLDAAGIPGALDEGWHDGARSDS